MQNFSDRLKQKTKKNLTGFDIRSQMAPSLRARASFAHFLTNLAVQLRVSRLMPFPLYFQPLFPILRWFTKLTHTGSTRPVRGHFHVWFPISLPCGGAG